MLWKTDGNVASVRLSTMILIVQEGKGEEDEQ